MKSALINKLCLGTAQFGLNYGIANKKGRISKEEVFEILEYAHRTGIDTLDTAYSYGDSEEVIGKFISKSNRSFNIISKAPHLNKDDIEKVKNRCLETLDRLRQPRIYGYLVHNFDNIVSYKEDLLDKIESLKREGLVDKTGISLYNPKEARYLFDNQIFFDIIQIPYSILDQRFKECFRSLKEKSTMVYARSVFLQGLLFIEADKIERDFHSAKKAIDRLDGISKEYNIHINSLYLGFVLLNPFIDKVIIGVDSLKQLKENIASLDYIDKVKNIYDLLESLRLDDEKVILPYNWKI